MGPTGPPGPQGSNGIAHIEGTGPTTGVITSLTLEGDTLKYTTENSIFYNQI